MMSCTRNPRICKYHDTMRREYMLSFTYLVQFTNVGKLNLKNRFKILNKDPSILTADFLSYGKIGISIMCDSEAMCLPYVWTVVSVYSFHNKNPTNRVGLEQSSHHHLIKRNLFSSWYSLEIPHLVLNINHSLWHFNYYYI